MTELKPKDIDRLAEQIMGWTLRQDEWDCEWLDGDGHVRKDYEWNPHEDISDAMMVVEKMRADGWTWELSSCRDTWFAFRGQLSTRDVGREADTLPMAICLTAIAELSEPPE